MLANPAKDFAAAVHEFGAAALEAESLMDLAPGFFYVLELPSGKLGHMGKPSDCFPPAFYKLARGEPLWSDLVTKSHRDRYLEASQAESFCPEIEYRIRLNRRGETAHVCDHRTLVRNDLGHPVAIVGVLSQDRYREPAMEALSKQSWKRIATLMTRRYLHDFNNTIAGIYSLSELYAEPGSDAASMCEAMVHIRDCASRARALTQQIRHLNVLELGQVEYKDLAAFCSDQIPYIEALLPKGCKATVQAVAGEYPARVDPNLFQQAILHLAANAVEACGADPRINLRISASRDRSGAPAALIEFFDNGPGFTAKDLAEACQPLYTTKDRSAHPGLGLSVVKDFALGSGGQLSLANSQDGAVARITLPLLVEDEPEEGESRESMGKSEEQAPQRTVHFYSWEDASNLPLTHALKERGWAVRSYTEPRDMLVEIAPQKQPRCIVFNNPLDKQVDPLLSELAHAANAPKLALLNADNAPQPLDGDAKRACAFVASASAKHPALASRLANFFD